MDNAYYTGATLIRAGNINGGGNCSQVKYNPFSVTARNSGTPPLPVQSSCQIQPNLLTGLPLIRNGQQPHVTPQNGHGSQGPPGVICCFQPIYYIPTPSPPAPAYNPPILLSANTNKQNVNCGIFQQYLAGKQGQGPKRRNYKSLIPNHSKLKPVQSSPLTSQGDRDYYQKQSNFNHHPKLTATSSFPDPISPPAKLSHPTLTRTTSNYFFSPDESDTSNEEKQRNDKLLNFYFEKHWRPTDEKEGGGWINPAVGHNDPESINENRWEIDQQRRLPNKSLTSSSTQPELITSVSSFDRQPGAGRITSSPPTMLRQQKDLEVEAQIITLANGHRDLEIRLCYVTS